MRMGNEGGGWEVEEFLTHDVLQFFNGQGSAAFHGLFTFLFYLMQEIKTFLNVTRILRNQWDLGRTPTIPIMRRRKSR